MAPALSTVWLHAQPPVDHPTNGCGGCAPHDALAPCRAALAVQACAMPQLSGPPDQLQQVMSALNRQVVDPAQGRGIVDLQWVRALRLQQGEAELTLGFAPACGPAQELTERAFHALRQLLPDTDVYVRHGA